METIQVRRVLVGMILVSCGMLISIERSQTNNGLTLSFVKPAHARVGRPLTPGSVAGVHRRVKRRAVRHHYRY